MRRLASTWILLAVAGCALSPATVSPSTVVPTERASPRDVPEVPGGPEALIGALTWHYRWIGREAAAAHRASDRSLREFLERYAAP